MRESGGWLSFRGQWVHGEGVENEESSLLPTCFPTLPQPTLSLRLSPASPVTGWLKKDIVTDQ